jgi:hypothetical protein
MSAIANCWRSSWLLTFLIPASGAFLTAGTYILLYPIGADEKHRQMAYWDATLKAEAHSEEMSASGFKEGFDSRLKSFKEKLDHLTLNLKIQALLILFSFLLVLGSESSLNVPMLGTPIPVRWLHVVLPLTLTYFWLQFGFLLNDLVYTKASLWKLLEAARHHYFITAADRQYLLPLLRDNGLIDLWCISFRPTYDATDPKYSSRTAGLWLLGLVFGGLSGMGHGSALGVLCNSWRRFASSNLSRCLHLALAGMLVAVFYASHYWFYSYGLHPNWMQFIVGFVAVVTTASLPPLGARMNTMTSRGGDELRAC